MVQLTSSVAVAVLLAAPSLATPFRAAPHVVRPGSHLEAREPRIGAALGKLRKVFTSDRIGAAAEVVGAGAAVGAVANGQPTARDLDEFDAREPVFGKIFKGAKKIAGGAARVAAGALSGRDLDLLEELAEREPILGGLVFKAARKAVGVAAGALSGRDLEEFELSTREIDALDELATREPVFRAIAKKIKSVFTSKRVGAGAEVVGAGAAVGAAASEQPTARDLDEFDTREPIFGKIFKGAKKVAGGAARVAAGALSGRDLDLLEELAEREPILGGLVFKAARKAVGVAAGALSGRELEEFELSAREIDALDELATREPIFRAIAKKVKSVFTSKRVGAGAEVVGAGAAVGAAASGEPTPRDLDEFDAREPVFGKIFKGAKKVAGGAARVAAGALSGRELHLSAPEIDELEELAARDPAFRAIAKKVKGLFTSKRVGGAAEAVGVGAAIGGAATQEQPAQRDLSFIEDLIARDFEFDELD